MVLTDVINGVFQQVDPGRNAPGEFELTQAINQASLDLYLELRGNLRWYKQDYPNAAVNFEENTPTTDTLQEFYRVYSQPGAGIVTIISNNPVPVAEVVDRVQILEVQYVQNGELSPVVFYPDNQFQLMKKNTYMPPNEENPIGRLEGLNTFEIFPAPVQVRSRCLIMPQQAKFTMTPSGGPVPTITPIQDLTWQADKVTLLIDRVVKKLGIQFANQNLIRGAESESAKIL